ncbi:hypothetical protein [Pseudohoeflea coraliihabitans]|uniref:N,N-dimethylformamidase alpha subunit domain-containing protein n=1 Tax=Pseudohoeflea coraliihabitans TaxID=2860393 RepID=A0ABS6WMK2_9HYPH|nr:hypothetical protein [Pseudohoeflea sp. DP4N28-3]MBW3096642.1 hypothetical protein [Pseudohoeflea sp. DP4N28-3]
MPETDTDIEAAFLADPFADHGPELQRLLFALRDQPAAGKLVLIEVEPGRKWQLARLGGRGQPVERLDHYFDDLRAAERHVFRLRLDERQA